MEFTIYKYFKKHPHQRVVAKLWTKIRLPLPGRIKRQLANEIHAEMITRLMREIVEGEKATREKVLEAHYMLGKEIGQQTKELLSINPNSAKDLSRIIDFLHDVLLIKGKKVIVSSDQEAVSHWFNCPLYGQLHQSTCGKYYCHLYQEIYKGVLFAINPNAKANTLEKTRSQGHEYCELKTWIEEWVGEADADVTNK